MLEFEMSKVIAAAFRQAADRRIMMGRADPDERVYLRRIASRLAKRVVARFDNAERLFEAATRYAAQ
jgi:hypothetical protein